MGPGAEPGFHLAFHLVAIGLAQPSAIVIGVAAGWLVRRWWLAGPTAMGGLAAVDRATTHIPPDGHGLGAMFLTAFALSAGIWAAVAGAARATVQRHGDRL